MLKKSWYIKLPLLIIGVMASVTLVAQVNLFNALAAHYSLGGNGNVIAPNYSNFISSTTWKPILSQLPESALIIQKHPNRINYLRDNYLLFTCIDNSNISKRLTPCKWSYADIKSHQPMNPPDTIPDTPLTTNINPLNTTYLPPPVQLVGEYKFNGNANEPINGHHGAVRGPTLTEDRSGIPNAAYAFDGRDDYISLGDPLTYQFVGDYTLSVWIYFPDPTPQIAPIIQKKQRIGLGSPQYSLHFLYHPISGGPDDYPHFFYRPDQGTGNGAKRIDPTGTLSVGWHHLVVTNEANGAAKLYIDGNFIQASRQNAGTSRIAEHDLLIGGNPLTNQYYRGKIDDIQLYNGALDASAITNLYQTQLSYPNKVFAELVQELDGGYTDLENNTLHFKFIQEYAVAGFDIDYTIYNWQRQVVHASTFTPSYGINWISIPLSLPPSEYYLLEIKANKGEKYFLRFKN